MTNNKLTDTQLAVKLELDGYRIQESHGFATARAMVGLFERIDSELAELQELRRNYLALRGEIEDVRSQLYEAENQANEYASELQERRKADSEPVAPKTLPCSVELNPGLIIGRGCKTETLLTALKRRADYYAELESMTPEQRAEHDAGIAEFKAMLGHSVITDTPPVPVVPEECPAELLAFCEQVIDSRITANAKADELWNACCAAMLQGSQPVINRDELPCAQVKAVADLYALCWQSGEVVTYSPDQEKATIWLNNYSGTCVQEYVKLERLQEALSGNSPVIPGGWISCSERIPDGKTGVLVAREFDRKGDWRMKWATYIPGHPDTNDGWLIPGASWKPSHWMPLPEPPQEVK